MYKVGPTVARVHTACKAEMVIMSPFSDPSHSFLPLSRLGCLCGCIAVNLYYIQSYCLQQAPVRVGLRADLKANFRSVKESQNFRLGQHELEER